MKKIISIFLLHLLGCPLFGQQGKSIVKVLDTTKTVCNEYQSKMNFLDSICKNFIKQSIESTTDIVKIDSSEIEMSQLLKSKNLFEIDGGEFFTSYAYGLLVGYVDTSSSRPMQSFKTHGNMNLNVAKIPIKFNFSYNSLKNPFGVNNYFRASVDFEKYKAQQNLQKEKIEEFSKKKIVESEEIKKVLIGKQGYAEILKHRLKFEVEEQTSALLKEQLIIDQMEENILDSVNSKMINSERLHFEDEKVKADSLREQIANSKKDLDQLLGLYSKIDSCNNRLQQLMKIEDSIQGLYNTQKPDILALGGNTIGAIGSKFFSHITKLDIGLTYPKTTALSSNSIPIKGVDFEHQTKNWYSSVSAGITMNNLMVTNDLVQSKLLYSQNMFNMFDFQNIKQKRFITMLKTGYGTKASSHIFLGVRYTNKAVLPNVIDGDSSIITPSLGLELDCRIKTDYLQGTLIDLVYGKTSNTEMQEDSLYRHPIKSLFSNDRTNLGLIKVSQSIKRIKSNISGSFRWIDSKSDMASLGVLQPNNIRYEFSTKHSLTNAISLSTTFRSDRNNVDNKLDSTMHLLLAGGSVSAQLFDKVDLFGNLHYLTQSVERNSMFSDSRSENYMYSFGITGNYKIGTYKHAVSLSYNDYLITTQYDNGRYKNLAFQNLTKLSNGQNCISVNYFSIASTDTMAQKTMIIGDELSYIGDKTQLKLGLKISYSKEFGNDLGYKVEVNRLLTSHLEGSLKVEKFILGNFYSSFDLDRFNRFPFLFMLQFNYKLK